MLAFDQFGDGIDLVGRERDDRGAPRLARQLAVAGEFQLRDPLDAALDLMWEIHQGPVLFATIEMWVAARTDQELRAQLDQAEPAARASLIRFAEAAFGDYAQHPRFRHIMYTCMDAVRGIMLLGLSDSDSHSLDARWKRAKADLRVLIDAAMPLEGQDRGQGRINGVR